MIKFDLGIDEDDLTTDDSIAGVTTELLLLEGDDGTSGTGK